MKIFKINVINDGEMAILVRIFLEIFYDKIPIPLQILHNTTWYNSNFLNVFKILFL